MKKYLIKILSMGLVALSVTTFNTFRVDAAWKQDSTGWWYTKGNSYIKGWEEIDGKWYFFKNDGYMAQNTIINGNVFLANGEFSLSASNALKLKDEDFSIENNTTLIKFASDNNYDFAYDVFYKDSSFKTYRGISLGSTYNDVISKYGDANKYGDGFHEYSFDKVNDVCSECPIIDSLAPTKIIEYDHSTDSDIYFLNFYFNSDNKVVMILFMKNNIASTIKINNW